MIEVRPNIKLYNADCMEIMKNYPDDYFDLAIVDPPYGIKRFKNGIGKNDRLTIKATPIFNNNVPTKKYFSELFRISKNQIIWGANNFDLPPSEYFLIWDKMQFMPNFASAELAFVSMGLKKPAKVFRYSIHKHNRSNKIHPTQKPIPLYKWLLKNYAKPEFKILDTHLGSGSHAIAAHYFGVSEFVGIELDKEYFDNAVKRIRQDTAQLTMF